MQICHVRRSFDVAAKFPLFCNLQKSSERNARNKTQGEKGKGCGDWDDGAGERRNAKGKAMEDKVNKTGKGKRGITRRIQRDGLDPETISLASITSCCALIPYLPAESSGARTCNLGEIKQRKHTPHYFIHLGSYFELDGLVFGGSTDQARLLSRPYQPCLLLPYLHPVRRPVKQRLHSPYHKVGI